MMLIELFLDLDTLKMNFQAMSQTSLDFNNILYKTNLTKQQEELLTNEILMKIQWFMFHIQKDLNQVEAI